MSEQNNSNMAYNQSPENPQRDLEDCSPTSTMEKPPRGRHLSLYFQSALDNRNVDHVLLLCWFTTGLLDSTIFNAYRTFVSMQTGRSHYVHQAMSKVILDLASYENGEAVDTSPTIGLIQS